MDGGQVSSSAFAFEGDGENKTLPSFTYTELFERECPYYLSIGMTLEEYWRGDPVLAKYYRRAEKMRQNRRNSEMYLQGRYYYDALIAASPVLNAFGKAEPLPYLDMPYPLTEKQAEERKAIREKTEYENQKAQIEKMFTDVNMNFRDKEG